MDTVEQQSGKLVSLEGDEEAISTQLRLLPPSQKILILPSFIQDLSNGTDEKFNVRSIVREVHTVFTERTETAQTFLRASTDGQPRLVFMNGGSVSARAICISRICETLTKWNVKEAETIFNDCVKDGVTGLMKDEECRIERLPSNELELTKDEGAHLRVDIDESSTAKLTPTSDTLDQEAFAIGLNSADTATMLESRKEQTTNDSHIELLPTASHQIIPVTDEDVFATSLGDRLVTTILTVPNPRRRFKRDSCDPRYKTAVGHQGDDGIENNEELVGQDSGTTTPAVIYGEACIVDVNATPPPLTPDQLSRTAKPVDRLHPSNSSVQDVSLDSSGLSPIRSTLNLQPRRSKSEGAVDGDGLLTFAQLPRTTFVKASQTTIKRSPTGSPRSTSSSSLKPMIRVFIDKGTDPGDNLVDTLATISKPVEEVLVVFQPIFPVVEDLVIHFTSDISNEIFDFVLSSLKCGDCLSSGENTDHRVSSILPISCISPSEFLHKPSSQFTADTDGESFYRHYESDLYSSSNDTSPNQWPDKYKSTKHDSAIQTSEPSSPKMVLSLSKNGTSNKICEFTPVNRDNVIGVQNSLRALLAFNFPTEMGYSQHYFPVVPEADRLWKPVWSCDERDVHEARSVDQIIALGCEDGVHKDFFSQISGQVERLGMKRSGINRSGRLDLRYLSCCKVSIIY